jgi:hypothetical protein
LGVDFLREVRYGVCVKSFNTEDTENTENTEEGGREGAVVGF